MNDTLLPLHDVYEYLSIHLSINTCTHMISLQCIWTKLARLLVFRYEDVPGSYVTMDKPFLGEVVHTTCHLSAVAEQSVRQTGILCPIRATGGGAL